MHGTSHTVIRPTRRTTLDTDGDRRTVRVIRAPRSRPSRQRELTAALREHGVTR